MNRNDGYVTPGIQAGGYQAGQLAGMHWIPPLNRWVRPDRSTVCSLGSVHCGWLFCFLVRMAAAPAKLTDEAVAATETETGIPVILL